MTRGPKPGSNRQLVSVANMLEAWGDNAPDWVVIMAKESDRVGQRVIADKIGVSASVVSNVLKKKYGIAGHAGDLRAVEQAVRGALMDAITDCPQLGPIPAHKCLAFQRQKKNTASPLNIRMGRACVICPNNLKGN